MRSTKKKQQKNDLKIAGASFDLSLPKGYEDSRVKQLPNANLLEKLKERNKKREGSKSGVQLPPV